jgi:hypothetical protein
MHEDYTYKGKTYRIIAFSRVPSTNESPFGALVRVYAEGGHGAPLWSKNYPEGVSEEDLLKHGRDWVAGLPSGEASSRRTNE